MNNKDLKVNLSIFSKQLIGISKDFATEKNWKKSQYIFSLIKDVMDETSYNNQIHL